MSATVGESTAAEVGGVDAVADEGVLYDREILQAYETFFASLLFPESSVIVMAMKNFLFQWTLNHYDNDDDGGEGISSSQSAAAASSLNSYCQSTFDSLMKSNKPRRSGDDNNDPSKLRRSVESFVYGQVRDVIQKGIDVELRKEVKGQQQEGGEDSDVMFTMTPSQFEDRLKELQFIQPSHLEIACLKDDEEIDANTSTGADAKSHLTELLQAPIRALLSVDAYHSPREKLQQILLVYQGVNAALSTALNEGNITGSTILPSADDVLPSIILVCIKARPRTLLQNIQFIEQFALPEYLRGEAGYAYTNLYGAIQFLQDLDLKHDDGSTPSQLSISAADLKAGLEKSRKLMQVDRSKEGDNSSSKKEFQNPLLEDTGLPVAVPQQVKLSVQEVHQALSRGESVDLNWAATKQDNLQQQQQPQEPPNAAVAHLPDGFRRNYTFLNAQPSDIRLADLPQLLEEYNMLVHVTEELLGERAARLVAERKQREMKQQQSLGEKLLLGDPKYS